MIYESGENWCQWRPAAGSPEPGRRGSMVPVPWRLREILICMYAVSGKVKRIVVAILSYRE